MKNFLFLGKALNKAEQKTIVGGTQTNVKYSTSDGMDDPDWSLVYKDVDSDGRECRPPAFVNDFGRCTFG